VARVELARAAVEDLDRLITTLSLPVDTRERARASLRPLAELPRLGVEPTGRWQGLRVILGPWRWMLLVHLIDEAADCVVIVTIQDARTSSAATSG
jgi:plasmid stabilization system protein ParE